MSITGSLLARPLPTLSPLYQLPSLPVRRFSVAEYQRLIEIGILKEEDRVELLDGWITPKMTINPPHAAILSLAQDAVSARLAGLAWRTRTQSPIALATSQPEPDLTVVIGPLLRYLVRHPDPADIAFVVEVADSSLDYDRDTKGPLYADAGIPIYWIVNLVDWTVEVYTQPTPSGYTHRQVYQRGDLVPLVLGGQAVAQVPVVELIG